MIPLRAGPTGPVAPLVSVETFFWRVMFVNEFIQIRCVAIQNVFATLV